MICFTQNSRPQTEPFTAKHTALVPVLCLPDVRCHAEHLKQLVVVGGKQHTYRCVYSIFILILYDCVCVEQMGGRGRGRGRSGHCWGPIWGASGRMAIGYSQNYFHMVQCPLVMSCTAVAWLPPPQHHPFNPCLSGETMEKYWSVHVCQWLKCIKPA